LNLVFQAHIFEKAIVGELLRPIDGKERSVILVTNSLQFLKHPKVSKVVVVQDGRIAEQGSYADLAGRSTSFFARTISVINDSTSNLTVTGSKSNTVKMDRDELRSVDKEMPLATGVAKTMTEETRLTGHVSLSVYWTWAKAAGGLLVPIVIIVTFAIGEGTQVLSNWFLTYWSSHGEEHTQKHFLLLYAAITFCAAVADTFRILAVIGFSLVASRRLFAGMLASILHAPMSFFDTTPTGRLVNRFSKGKTGRLFKLLRYHTLTLTPYADMYTIDEGLNDTLINYLWTLFNVLSTIIVISGVTPIFALCLIPVMVFYLNEQSYFTVSDWCSNLL
jgi:ATP-binding cassette, subfamily C (CFTR/MRP), member 1